MDKGEGGIQNPENFADVLYVWPLREHLKSKSTGGCYQRDGSPCIQTTNEPVFLLLEEVLVAGDRVAALPELPQLPRRRHRRPHPPPRHRRLTRARRSGPRAVGYKVTSSGLT